MDCGRRVDRELLSGMSGIASRGGIGGLGDRLRVIVEEDSADSDGAAEGGSSINDKCWRAVNEGEGGISFGSISISVSNKKVEV